MEAVAMRRLMRDFRSLEKDPPPGISVDPSETNFMYWRAIVVGPYNSPWEGGAFKLTLVFPKDYPIEPPVVQFVSKMFHPNVAADGTVCLNILEEEWSSVLDVASILISIQSFLCDPNTDVVANVSAAGMYDLNRRNYNRRICDVVDLSWNAS